MLNTNKKGKLFARRALVLGGIKGGLFSALIARLYYLQIVKSDEFKTFADSNRIKLFLIPPLRGKILDRDGRIFVSNRNFYRVLFDPEVSSNVTKTVELLSKLLKLDPAAHQRMMHKAKNHPPHRSVILYEHLTWDEVCRLEVHAPDLPGISIDVGQIRHFTMGDVAPHVIGYLGPVTEKEIDANPLLNHPDFKIGRSGIEKVFENTLRGKAGVRRMEVNAFGLSVRELSREESHPGNDLRLSMDKRLQEFVGKRLEGKSASGIVIDVVTGEVLAMCSTPGFDPNQFTYGVKSDYWQQLNTNIQKPMINKSVSNQYPPGSTFKTVVALTGLKDGVDPNATVYCPGYTYLGNHRFNCWKKDGHGAMNMRNGIMHSCNIFFFSIAKRVGIDKIAAMAEKFGLGHDLDIILPGEAPGLMPTQKWKKKRYGIPWQSGDTLNCGIGQGYVLTTPIQLAVMASRLATGREVFPRFTPLQPGEAAPKFKSLEIPEEHLDIVREGMRRVINVPGGTAYGSRVQSDDFVMAGKTGTSQVISKKGLEESAGSLTAAQKALLENHALFIGFGSFENPRYATSVIVEHGVAGSQAAAPVGRDILYEAYKLRSGKEKPAEEPAEPSDEVTG